MSVAFTVHGHAEPAGSKRAFVIRGRAVVTDDNGKSRPWKDTVGWYAREAMAGRPIYDGPLVVSMTFYRARPKGHTGRHGLNANGRRNPFPIVKPDALKLARAVEDAMTGIVYRDDAQIVCEILWKKYGDPERVEVSVEPMDVAGALAERYKR